MQAAFESEIGRLTQGFNTPGLAVEMMAGGQHFKACVGHLAADRPHPVTEKARFGTVCMIKLLVTIKVLQLAEQNALGLDMPIGQYLPELAQSPASKGRILTVRHLLSHTGGFRSFTADRLLPLAHESWENCVRLLNDTDQLFTPGTVFNDDHLSHIILGQLIEQLTGQPFLQAVRDDVLAPLGIKPSDRSQDCEFPHLYAARHAWNPQARQWEPEPDLYREPSPAFAAISHLSLTCGDLLTLGQALLPGSRHFSPWILDRLFKQEVAVPRTFHPSRITRWHARGFSLGMSLFRDGHAGFVSTGPGQTCGIFFDKQRKSLGAISSTAERNVGFLVQHNVRATLSLVEWCTQEQKPLIYASSAATYGDGGMGFHDDDTPDALARLRPVNAYGWSKHVVDRRIARLKARGDGLPPQLVGLKFFNVYGPNEYHKSAMQSVIAKNYAEIAKGGALRLFRSTHPGYPDGGQMRDFIAVGDCVAAMLWLRDRPAISGLLNIGSGRARSWLDLAKALFAAAGKDCAVEFIDMPAELAAGYQNFTQADISKLRALGYDRPMTSLEDGIRDYVAGHLSQPDPYL